MAESKKETVKGRNFMRIDTVWVIEYITAQDDKHLWYQYTITIAILHIAVSDC